MSKGHTQRPKQVSEKEYSDNWARIFGKSKKEEIIKIGDTVVMLDGEKLKVVEVYDASGKTS